MLSLVPTPIGNIKKIRSGSKGTIDFDFSTRWGLVDIRECDIEVKRYTLVQKKTKGGRKVLDANDEPIMERKYKDPIILPSSYCVLMELKKNGRLKPMLKYRKGSREEVKLIERKQTGSK